MCSRLWPPEKRHQPSLILGLLLSAMLVLLAACSGQGTATTTGSNRPPAHRQILTLPNVGAQDVDYLDPAQTPDPNDPAEGLDLNTSLVIKMIYSGLVRSDQNLNVVPDQATWDISNDGKVYTFHLKPGITFSDGTPVTAQTYVYTFTRALSPAEKSPVASDLAQPIVGASAFSSGKSKTLAGVHALNAQTLQITLKQPTPYFLEALTNESFYPVNKRLIDIYGENNWENQVVGNGVGTGPFILTKWERNVKMILTPNPHYYGAKTHLAEVDMVFVSDPDTAYQEYRAGQYDLIWNIPQQDLQPAKGMAGYVTAPMLQTDMLFFNTKAQPFDDPAVRQAFAYALNKQALADNAFKDSVVPASTILPPGMPGYQANYKGLAFDSNKARELLRSVYPDPGLVPPITFTYPSSLMSPGEARMLQGMWTDAMHISVRLLPTEQNAYNDEVANHQVQLGFMQWYASYPDPYNYLASLLLSNAPDNNGQWQNSNFDQLIKQAEQATGNERLALYNKAEQLAINDVALLPLDHQALSAVIPSWVHGVTLNAEGLYFGDWSQVTLTRQVQQ